MQKREMYLCAAHLKHQDNGNYFVEFPDLEGCMTYGRTLEEAMEKAQNACAGWLLVAQKNNLKIPSLNMAHITDSNRPTDAFVNLFLVNLSEYKRKIGRKAVKKNCTLPSWLCELADSKNVNYSKVLQDALKETLGADDC